VCTRVPRQDSNLHAVPVSETGSLSVELRGVGATDGTRTCVASLACWRPAIWTTAAWWPLRDAVVLTDRPTILGRDGRGDLPAEHGPALAWADGYTLHALHGNARPREPGGSTR